MSYIRSYHVSYQDIPIKAYPGEWIEAIDSHEVVSEDNGKPLSINNVLVLSHHNSPSLLDSSSSDSTLIIVRFPNPLASSQLGNLTKFSSVCNSKNPIRLNPVESSKFYRKDSLGRVFLHSNLYEYQRAAPQSCAKKKLDVLRFDIHGNPPPPYF